MSTRISVQRIHWITKIAHNFVIDRTNIITIIDALETLHSSSGLPFLFLNIRIN